MQDSKHRVIDLYVTRLEYIINNKKIKFIHIFINFVIVLCKYKNLFLPCPAPELLENIEAKAQGTLKVTCVIQKKKIELNSICNNKHNFINKISY